MGQIIRSLTSVCVCVCVCVCVSVCLSVSHRSCCRNFEQNWMKLYTVAYGRKTKIFEGQNPIMPSHFPRFLLILMQALQYRRPLTDCAINNLHDALCRRWWCLTEYGINPNVSPILPKLRPIQSHWECDVT